MKLGQLLFLLLIITTSNLWAQNQKAAIRFINQAQQKINKSHSFQYNIDLCIKESMQIDTFKVHTKVKLAKNKTDIFFGYDLLIQNQAITNYYTLGKYYRIDHINKSIYPGRFLDPKKIDKTSGPFTQSHLDETLLPFLISSDYFSQIINNPKLVITKKANKFCGDTIYIHTQDITGNQIIGSDSISNLHIEYKFLRKTKMPVEITKTGIGRMGNYYWNIKIEYEKHSQDSIEAFFLKYRLPIDYELIENEVTTYKPTKTKFQPIPLPKLQLADYKGKEIDLNNLTGKVILLDFWYSTCAPCIKASHYIDEIAMKYADSNLVVYGVNPVDNIPRIEKHYDRWKMKYNTLVISEETKNLFQVNSYPSFILINKNGMIIYHNFGFSVALMKEIEQEIQKALRE